MMHRRELRAKSFRFMRRTTRHCPYCGAPVNTASTRAKLSPGDLVYCLDCGRSSVYTEAGKLAQQDTPERSIVPGHPDSYLVGGDLNA